MLHRIAEHDPSQHQIEQGLNMLNVLGMDTKNGHLELYLSDQDRAFPEKFYAENAISVSDKVVVIHPFAGYPSKKWPEERFSSLIKKLVAIYRAKAIIIGTARERKAADAIISRSGASAINAAGKTSLGQAAAVISKADLFIGLDSGPAHIAAAVGSPAVVLYSGTNDPVVWRPRSKRCEVIRKDVPCRGCGRTDCADMTCMDTISADEVFESAKKGLSNAKLKNRL